MATQLNSPFPRPSAVSSRRLVASVLIIDSDTETATLCQESLQYDTYELLHVVTAEEALALLRERSVDLLLCDLQLPDQDGLTLASLARDLHPTIAVILMTSQATLETLREAVQRGVTSYLSKPFHADELRLTVARALHRRSMIKENLRLDALLYLLELSNALNGLISVDPICEQLVKIAGRVMDSACGYVMLTTTGDEQRLLHIGEHEGWLSDEGWQMLRRAINDRQVVVGDVSCCGGLDAITHNIAFPLLAQGEAIGALLLTAVPRTEAQPLSAIEMTSLLATHAASALRNAQLYEQRQEALARLQEIDRLKSDFISIASHELRSPLALVLGYSTMMLRDEIAPMHQEFLRRVVDSAMRINDIVDDMVNLHHLETGEVQMEWAHCSLRELLDESITAIEPLAQAKDQSIVREYDSHADCELWLDREKISLVIGNLLSNAVKFTPEQGAITVRGWCGRVTASKATPSPVDVPLPPGEWAYIAISDTGIGIPPQHQRRIFERFYQVSDSLTREHGGTGLGLALVRGMVELHGGRVWVRSEEGQGSTFSFALPLRRSPQAESQSDSSAASQDNVSS